MRRLSGFALVLLRTFAPVTRLYRETSNYTHPPAALPLHQAIMIVWLDVAALKFINATTNRVG